MVEFIGKSAADQQLHASAVRFTRRDVREAFGWSDFQIHTHLTKLVELEYVLVHRGKRGRRYVYELLYSGQGREGQPFLAGLIDPARLEPAASTPPSSSPVELSSSMAPASSSTALAAS